MEHSIFLSKEPEYFNASQPPPPPAASLPHTSQYPMHGIPVDTALYAHAHSSIAPYINPSMSNSIATQFIPNGNCYWPTPPVTQHNATPPFFAHSPSTPHMNLDHHQQNTQPRRIDPRLLPRPEFQPTQRPSQSTPVQRWHDAGRTRWNTPIDRTNESTAKQRITYADYKKQKSQLNQGDDANTAKNAPNSCDKIDKPSNNNVVLPVNDPRPSKNDDHDNASKEPAISPAVSESEPNLPVSLTPPPPNESVPDDEMHEPENDRGSINNQSNSMPEIAQAIKQENPQIGCESDVSTEDDYDSDATAEFTYEALRREHGLSVGNAATEMSPCKF